MKKRSMSDLNRLTPEAFRAAEKTQIIIILDNIRSQHNVGSVFRTADAFLLQGIRLCGITATPPHREIHKTALGATESVEWRYHATTAEAVTELIREGWKIVAVEQVEGGTLLNEFIPMPGEKLAILFGNEVNGVEDELLGMVHTAIEIPQFGTKHSINVSVAVGMVIWDIFVKLKKVSAK